MQLAHSRAGPLAELVDRPELYRLRRTGLGAGGDESVALAVVAECALVGMAVERASRDHAEGTRGHTGRAAVADVGLNEDVLELVVDDGARRARLLTRRGDAVLADVAHHQPAPVLRLVEQSLEREDRRGHPRLPRIGTRLGERGLVELLDELHVTPRGRGKCPGVVVAVAGPVKTIGRQQVPRLARDLAGLAADTHGGVGEEACGGAGLRRRDGAKRIDEA